MTVVLGDRRYSRPSFFHLCFDFGICKTNMLSHTTVSACCKIRAETSPCGEELFPADARRLIVLSLFRNCTKSSFLEHGPSSLRFLQKLSCSHAIPGSTSPSIGRGFALRRFFRRACTLLAGLKLTTNSAVEVDSLRPQIPRPWARAEAFHRNKDFPS